MDRTRMQESSQMRYGNENTSSVSPSTSISSSATSDASAPKAANKEEHLRSIPHASYGQELLNGSKVFAYEYCANAYCPGAICGADAKGRHLVKFCGDSEPRPAALNGVVLATRLREGLKAFMVTSDETKAAREIVLCATPEFANTAECLLQVFDPEAGQRFSVPWTSLRFTKKELNAVLVDMASPNIDEANILSGRRSKRPRISDFPFITGEEEVSKHRYGCGKRSRGSQRRQLACREGCANSPGASTDANSDKKHRASPIGNVAAHASQVLAPCSTIEKPSELNEYRGDGPSQEVSVLKVVPASRQPPLHDGDPHQQQAVTCYGNIARRPNDICIYYKSQQYAGHVFKFAPVETFEWKGCTRRHYVCADCLQLYETNVTTLPPVIIVTVNDSIVERDPDAPLGIRHSCKQSSSSTFQLYTLP